MTAAPLPVAAPALWRALLGIGDRDRPLPSAGDCQAWTAALSPGLVGGLVPDLALAAPAVQEARLFGRYQQALQVQALGWIADAGIDCVALKGFAAAFLYYPDPACRLIGDLDLLVRAATVPALVEVFQDKGFRFGIAQRRPWGFLSDASFMPLHSPDGNCNIDIHVQPDSYPLHLALDVDQVLRNARQVVAGGQAVSLPQPVHMAAILVSNLAKDKFAPDGLRKLLDLARLLRHEHDFAWPDLIELLQRARLGKALETTVCLLRGLGTPAELLPASLGHARGSLLDALLLDWWRQTPPGLARRLVREWTLAAEPDVAATLAWRRLRGLLAAGGGVPR